jgi:hypothetical protein
MRKAIFHMTERDIVRFWSKVDVRGPNECWPWKGAKHSKEKRAAYGSFRLNRVTVTAHQIAAFLSKGNPEPSTPCTLHTCDNPPCCNGNHLFYGTQLDNIKDATRKKRMPGSGRGIQNTNAKLTAHQVREIRSSPLPQRKLARMYGLAAPNICMVKTGKSYKDVN